MTLADFDQGSLQNFPIGAYIGTRQWIQSHPNTVAAFLRALEDSVAHAAGETGGLDKLEETTIQDKSYKGFEGRGPIQVTTEGNYVQTLAYM